MRVAQIAPIAHPVAAGVGESVEQLVWLLCEELVRRGPEVTLFATGDSDTSARLASAYPRGYEQDSDLWDWRLHETVNAAQAFERAGEFDLIHSHAYHFALPFTRLVSTPVVHTYHVEMDQDVLAAYRRYPEAHLVAVSQWQRSTLPDLPVAEVIPHGIDVAAFPFRAGAGGHLLFLGRMIEDKGPLEAVRLARELGLPLVLAGPGSEYFEEHVRPLVDGEQISYVGRVGLKQRGELLARAGALLLPLTYPEPFGLVMVEAMACGTPVVACSLGAVPELVQDGVSGFCAPTPKQLGELVPRALGLDRSRVREYALRRFDYRQMVERHEALYRRLVERERPA